MWRAAIQKIRFGVENAAELLVLGIFRIAFRLSGCDAQSLKALSSIEKSKVLDQHRLSFSLAGHTENDCLKPGLFTPNCDPSHRYRIDEWQMNFADDDYLRPPLSRTHSYWSF